MTIKNPVSLGVTPHSLVNTHRVLKKYLSLQDRRISCALTLFVLRLAPSTRVYGLGFEA
jgi:hypothetical protein